MHIALLARRPSLGILQERRTAGDEGKVILLRFFAETASPSEHAHLYLP
jgi:hypothetical protein